MIKPMRDYFDEHGFLDVETPMLGRSTPEGARDYLVPSRVQHGHVLRPAAVAAALQADPDGRRLRPLRAGGPLLSRRRPACRPPARVHAVRLEMSFVDGDDVIGIDRRAGGCRWRKKLLGLDVKLPLPRMTYDEAMERFGHDAPDLRFGMELVDITDLADESRFRVFREAADARRPRPRPQRQRGRGQVLAQRDRRAHGIRRARLRRQGAGVVQGRGRRQLASPIAKNFTPALLAKIRRADAGASRATCCSSWPTSSKSRARRSYAPAQAARRRAEALRSRRRCTSPGSSSFPMFAWDEEEKRWAAMHHPVHRPAAAGSASC